MQMTDKKMADILSSIKIVIDTREQKNDHIKKFLHSKDIPYKEVKMDSGDYTFELDGYPELELDHSILIERKNSLNEIASNFTKNRPRFEREFNRVLLGEHKINILIETATWKKLLNGSYRSKITPQSMTASLLTWHHRYNCPVWFCNKEESGYLIYNIIKYGVMEKLKEIRKNA